MRKNSAVGVMMMLKGSCLMFQWRDSADEARGLPFFSMKLNPQPLGKESSCLNLHFLLNVIAMTAIEAHHYSATTCRSEASFSFYSGLRSRDEIWGGAHFTGESPAAHWPMKSRIQIVSRNFSTLGIYQ